jgi:hypothetical protein
MAPTLGLDPLPQITRQLLQNVEFKYKEGFQDTQHGVFLQDVLQNTYDASTQETKYLW